MNAGAFVRRYRWSLAIVLAACLAWPFAFNYLLQFHKPDVPYVTTPPDVVAKILDLAEAGQDDIVYDLGSGDGRILIVAARDRGAKAVGLEIDPELVEKSREAIRAAGLSDRATVRRGDFFLTDLSPATVITLYMDPVLNARLRPQLEGLKPGTRVVSHMFSVPGAKPLRKIVVPSKLTEMDHVLYLFVAPIEWESK